MTAYYAAYGGVWFYGNALVNGSPTFYFITVADKSQPGYGLVIETRSGYSAGGTPVPGKIKTK